MHGYTYAWASKYASSRPLNTVLSSTPNTHPFTAATCPRVSIYEYWCLLTQYAESCVFTSPAYISPADDSNHRLCCIRISEPLCSAFHAREHHLSCRFFLSLFSSFRYSPPRNEKVFSIFAMDRIVHLNGCSLVDRSSFRGCFVGFVASLCRSGN